MSSKLSLITRLLAPAAAAALMFAGAVPASADTLTRDDRKRDVVKVDFFEQPWTFTPLPRNRAQDIVATTTAYGKRKLRLAVEVRELRLGGTTIFWAVRNADQEWWVTYHDGEVSLSPAEGEEAPCGGLRYDRQPAKERLVIVVPRNCIGPYNWVRTGLLVVGGAENNIADDANGRIVTGQVGPHLGRRVAYN